MHVMHATRTIVARRRPRMTNFPSAAVAAPPPRMCSSPPGWPVRELGSTVSQVLPSSKLRHPLHEEAIPPRIAVFGLLVDQRLIQKGH
ncbi:hypothetical protein [Burkholderia savannae]|uniref:hypothetical protein n=1 Tax=Burkholderia savannae TaxID=1637837 RepID=UPI000AE1300E|nr:hypothetical protein [Burkholderia savannae]